MVTWRKSFGFRFRLDYVRANGWASSYSFPNRLIYVGTAIISVRYVKFPLTFPIESSPASDPTSTIQKRIQLSELMGLSELIM